jgi:hypothetical protein
VVWRAGDALLVIDVWLSLLLDRYPAVWGQGCDQPRSGVAAFRLSPLVGTTPEGQIQIVVMPVRPTSGAATDVLDQLTVTTGTADSPGRQR